jgi:hypothetical protein
MTDTTLPPRFQQLLDGALKFARSQLVEQRAVAPVGLVFGPDDPVVVDMATDSDTEKDRLAFAIRELVKLYSADCVMLLTEAWTLPQHLAKDHAALRARYGSLGNVPGRLEIVMVSIETQDRSWLAQAPILRQGRAVKLGPPDVVLTRGSSDTMEITGRYAHFFSDEGH